MNNAIMIAPVLAVIHVIGMELSAVKIQLAMSEVRGRCYRLIVVILSLAVAEICIVQRKVVAFRR
jgi:hypothetical protein